MGNKLNLLDLSKSELNHYIKQIGEKSFRTQQLWKWIYQKTVPSFQEMTDISKKLRTKLETTACIGSLKLISKKKSTKTKTQKYLFQGEDGLFIESVYIQENGRHTICVSSQVGCKCGCFFCATAQMGFFRNLKTHEIVDQVLQITRVIKHKPTNIVLMGMGEPLLNFDNVIKALNILNSNDGLAIGHRKITISTVGIVPMIDRYTAEKHPYKLAISLNGTTDAQRCSLMPINQKYPIKKLLRSAKEYTKKTKRRVTFEYVLIKDINDTPADAERLLKLLNNLPCKVNLIGYNQTESQYQCSDETTIQKFSEIIKPICAPITRRLSKGNDIEAACGQLAIKDNRFQLMQN